MPSSPTVRRSAVALCLPTMGLGVVRTAKSTGDKKHFFYEADRGSMVMTDMLKKFRGYYHFVKKQQRHREAVGVHPIRAVLVETTDAAGRLSPAMLPGPFRGGTRSRLGTP